MAIQIEEKLLSAKAREALNNAKSKSKLLRDALEAYVRIDAWQGVQAVGDMEKDIKDIKNMLQKLTESGLQPGIISHIQQTNGIILEDKKELPQPVVTTPEKVVTTNGNEPIKEDKHQNKVTVQFNPESQEVITEEVNISEERKRQIEAMYDASLDNFGE